MKQRRTRDGYSMSDAKPMKLTVSSERVLVEALREVVERLNVEHGLQLMHVAINWNSVGPDAKVLVISSNVAAVMQTKESDGQIMQ